MEVLDRTPTAEEELAFFLSPEDRRAHQLLNKKMELENEQFERDMSNREKFADRAYGVTQAWVGFVIVITIAQFCTAKVMGVGLTEKEFMVVVRLPPLPFLASGCWLANTYSIGQDRRAPRLGLGKRSKKVKERPELRLSE